MHVTNTIITELIGEMISALAVKPVPGRPGAGGTTTPFQQPQTEQAPSPSPQQNPVPVEPQQPAPQQAPAENPAVPSPQAALENAGEQTLQRVLLAGSSRQDAAAGTPEPAANDTAAPKGILTGTPVPAETPPAKKKAVHVKPAVITKGQAPETTEDRSHVLQLRGARARSAYSGRENQPVQQRFHTAEQPASAQAGVALPFTRSTDVPASDEWEGGRQGRRGRPSFQLAVSLPAIGKVELAVAIVAGSTLRLRVRSRDMAFIEKLDAELGGMEHLASDMGLQFDAELQHVDAEEDDDAYIG